MSGRNGLDGPGGRERNGNRAGQNGRDGDGCQDAEKWPAEKETQPLPTGRGGRKHSSDNGKRKEWNNRESGLIPRHGGYRKLKSFQVAQLAYDVTARFCERYVSRFSRTNDQMVQAARSGVQNIAEGSEASGTSKKTELKLTGVARSSLEELRLDYEDYLRQKGMEIWSRSDPRRGSLIARRCTSADEVEQWIRQLQAKSSYSMVGRGSDPPDASARSTGSILSIKSRAPRQTKEAGDSATAEIMANAALALIAVAGSLLDRQLDTLAREFEEKGGFTERMYRRRVRKRNRLKS